MKLEPTDEELEAAIFQCGGDFHMLDVRDLVRLLAPIIARKRRDATVAWLRMRAAVTRSADCESLARILDAQADAIARDEDLEP